MTIGGWNVVFEEFERENYYFEPFRGGHILLPHSRQVLLLIGVLKNFRDNALKA